MTDTRRPCSRYSADYVKDCLPPHVDLCLASDVSALESALQAAEKRGEMFASMDKAWAEGMEKENERLRAELEEAKRRVYESTYPTITGDQYRIERDELERAVVELREALNATGFRNERIEWLGCWCQVGQMQHENALCKLRRALLESTARLVPAQREGDEHE